jgi:hypothetical protein
MLCDYFSYINKEVEEGDKRSTSFYVENVSKRMEDFCLSNNLQTKAIKEVHYICLQLERLLFEATSTSSNDEESEIKRDFKSLFSLNHYPHPTDD